MGYRFLDDYDPRKEQKKKAAAKGDAESAPFRKPIESCRAEQ